MARAFLICLLIHGLVPSAAELVESVVHLATTGHVAHDAAHHEELPGDSEHGCGPTAHHCRCCASQPVVTIASTPTLVPDGVVPSVVWRINEPVAEGTRTAPFRPPIEA